MWARCGGDGGVGMGSPGCGVTPYGRDRAFVTDMQERVGDSGVSRMPAVARSVGNLGGRAQGLGASAVPAGFPGRCGSEHGGGGRGRSTQRAPAMVRVSTPSGLQWA